MHLSIPALIQSYGYPILFILVGAESMGLPLPGETALVTAAALAALGHLSIAAVIGTAAIAAIAGDSCGYWIGREGGVPFVQRYGRVLHLNESSLERAQRFFARHGAKTVFLGRFIALLRTWAAVLAGVARMPYGTFILYNALGGIIWALIFGILGYVFGQNLPMLQRYVGQASVALVLLLVIVVVLVLLWRRFDLSAEVLWEAAQRVWDRAVGMPFVQRVSARHPKLRAFVVARFSPGEYLGLHLTVGLLLSLSALWLLGGVTEDVVHHDPLTRFDVTLMEWFHRHQTPLGDRVFVAITNLGSPLTIGALAVIVAVVLLVRRERVLLTAWVVALAGGGLLSEVLKITIRRPRPPYAATFLQRFSFSFPSGHSIGALLGYGMFAYLLLLWVRPRAARIAVVTVAPILVAAIGFSRIYLGVHYFSDVVAGYAAGVVWVAACISGAEIARRKRGMPALASSFTHAGRNP
ncbi:MAG TPA: bifunctional DedA family/phosphatase PAP2 family protein [Gemmatimonadaceae bacterium]|jgi:undecaprenyl-diphosphatase